MNEGDTLSTLHGELAWELSWSASDLTQRRALLDAVLELQRTLIVVARDGRFVTDLTPDLAAVVQPPTRLFTAWALETLDHIVTDIKRADVEKDAAARTTFVHVKIELDKAASQVTDIVVSSLSPPMPPVERLYELDRATHCINAVSCAEANSRAGLRSQTRRRRHRRAQEHGRRRTAPTKALPLVHQRDSRGDASRIQPCDPTEPFGRAVRRVVSLAAIAVRLRAPHWPARDQRGQVGSEDHGRAVLPALAALVARLSTVLERCVRLKNGPADEADYAIRTATVPLLLALMPNSGLSVLSWIGQLS